MNFEHLHEEFDTVERCSERFSSGASDGSGREESSISWNKRQGDEGMLEELRRRWREMVMQFGFCDGDRGEFGIGGGSGGGEGECGVLAERGVGIWRNDVVFEVGDFVP